MPVPLTGSASVTNGSDVVTWTGAPLNALNCVVGAAVALDGLTYFVQALNDTDEFQLTRNYAGSTGTVTAEITQLSPNQVSTATLNKRAADVMAELNAMDANGRGLFYNLIGVTGANDPGPGNVAFNEVVVDDVTEIYFDVLDANNGNRDVTGIIDLWRSGTILIFRSLSSTAYAAFQVSSVETVAGWRQANVSFVDSDGDIAAEPVGVEWNIVGEGIQINRAGPFANRGTYDTVESPAPAGFTYASTDGANGAGPPTVLYVKLSGAYNDWGPAIDFQGPESEPRVAVTIWDPGRPAAAEKIWSGIFDVAVSFPTDFNGVNAVSYAKVGSTATATAVFSLRKNDVEFGTLSFGAGQTNGVFDATATAFDPGDVLSVIAPSPRDDTLAQISITLAGAR